MNLRDYQKTLVDKALEALERDGRTIAYAPTGAGKTVIAAEIVNRYYREGKRVLFVGHLQVLIPQTVAKFESIGIHCGVVKAGYKPSPLAPVQVCSIQTMKARSIYPEADLVIIDECHRAIANQYNEIFERYPKILGLTATPFSDRKISSRKLKDRFASLVWEVQAADLVEQGHLVEPKVSSWDMNEYLKGIKTQGGDYQVGGLSAAMNTIEIHDRGLRSLLENPDRRAIAFCVDVEHVQNFSTRAIDLGFKPNIIIGNTPLPERLEIAQRLLTKEIDLIVSCMALSEGFDAVWADLAICLRPTKSKTLYLQQVGRVLRLSASTGKTDAIVWDVAGNLYRHGHPLDRIDLSLDVKEIKPKKAGAAGEDTELPVGGGETEATDPSLIPDLVEISQAQHHNALIDSLILEQRSKGYRPLWIYHRYLDKATPTLDGLKKIAKTLGYHWRWAVHKFEEWESGQGKLTVEQTPYVAPTPGVDTVWEKALEHCSLASVRELYRQCGQLVSIQSGEAIIEFRPKLIPLAEAKVRPINEALERTIGYPVVIKITAKAG